MFLPDPTNSPSAARAQGGRDRSAPTSALPIQDLTNENSPRGAHLSTVSAPRRLAYRTSLRAQAHSAPPIPRQRTRIIQARGMQSGFLPPSRSRRLLPAAAREHLLHPVHDPYTSRAPHGSAGRLSRVHPPGPGALPVAHAVCVAETLGAQAAGHQEGRYFCRPRGHPPSKSNPFPNSASAFANCDSKSGKRKLETRRAAWQPARSTWQRRPSRRRRRRRSPAQPSFPHLQAGPRRFALNYPLGRPLPISSHALCTPLASGPSVAVPRAAGSC